MIVEIVSTYQDDGSTQFEFPSPASFANGVGGARFARPHDRDHERSLEAYDAAGVKAILQVEPGSADIGLCLDIVHAALGSHPCVIGYGIDAEWYRPRWNPGRWGQPVSDFEAQQWTEQVARYGRGLSLFIKHWRPSQLPPSYRNPNLWFLCDSQRFSTADALLHDYRQWNDAAGATTGYQMGYPSDRRWWSAVGCAPGRLGSAVLQAAPSCRYLLWVDFTADQVAFTRPRPVWLASRSGSPDRSAMAPDSANRLTLQPGQLGLQGIVEEIAGDGSTFTLLAMKCIFPDGSSVPIAPPRRKVIRVDANTVFLGLAMADLPGMWVKVAGADGGIGKVMSAALVIRSGK